MLERYFKNAKSVNWYILRLLYSRETDRIGDDGFKAHGHSYLSVKGLVALETFLQLPPSRISLIGLT